MTTPTAGPNAVSSHWREVLGKWGRRVFASEVGVLLASIGLALLVGAILIAWAGENPLEV